MIEAVDTKYIRALEQSAGARLFNIIVDSENTAKLLMKKESFGIHVNLIPNNKIQGNPIPGNVMMNKLYIYLIISFQRLHQWLVIWRIPWVDLLFQLRNLSDSTKISPIPSNMSSETL